MNDTPKKKISFTQDLRKAINRGHWITLVSLIWSLILGTYIFLWELEIIENIMMPTVDFLELFRKLIGGIF